MDSFGAKAASGATGAGCGAGVATAAGSGTGVALRFLPWVFHHQAPPPTKATRATTPKPIHRPLPPLAGATGMGFTSFATRLVFLTAGAGAGC